MPERGEKPKWVTENRTYPVELRPLWKRHQNPSELIGIGFSNVTNYVVYDIDRTSSLHPYNDPVKFCEFLKCVETIGLVCPVVMQSSLSEGLHVYYFLSEWLSTFSAACAIKGVLVEAGFTVRCGELECFPNVKGWEKEVKNYKRHRIPLQPQSGSHLMKAIWYVAFDDLPGTEEKDCTDAMLLGIDDYREELRRFLDEADQSAARNNIEMLQAAMSYHYEKRHHYKEYTVDTDMSEAALSWKLDLEQIIGEGWSGHGQTNELLKFMAVYGLVFLGIQGEELSACVEQRAIASPGYLDWCRHQHEIDKRSAEWAREVQKDNYYLTYRGFPRRLLTYRQMFNSVGKNNAVEFTRANSANDSQATLARERIAAAVTRLRSYGIYPTNAEKRVAAIITISKEMCGTGMSRQTLYKPNNLPLWHPKFDLLPDPWEEPLEDEVSVPVETVPSAPPPQLLLPPAVLREELQPEPPEMRRTPSPLVVREKSPSAQQPEAAADGHLGHVHPQSPNEGLLRNAPGTEAPQGVGAKGADCPGEKSSFQPNAERGDREAATQEVGVEAHEPVRSVAIGQPVLLRNKGSGIVEYLTANSSMVIRFSDGTKEHVAFWEIALEQGIISFPSPGELAQAQEVQTAVQTASVPSVLEDPASAMRLSRLRAAVQVRQIEWRIKPQRRASIRQWAQQTPGVKMTDRGPVLDVHASQNNTSGS